MTEDTSIGSTTIDSLKEEFEKQLNDLRSEFQSSMSEKDATIEQLKSDNEELRRSLVRSALTSAPAEPAPEKTEEELYQEKVTALYERSKQYQKMI